jgi:uncharacterized integral membrane protein
MTFLRFIIGLVLALFFSFFLIENSQIRVEFHIFGENYENVPLWIVIFISIIFGFSIASLIGLIEIIRAKLQLNSKERKIRNLEDELDKLREFILEEEE